ncbi:MAG TPA: glycosyltransferase family 39 protein [Acidimicrobiales bacterium]|jgi:4-amino-4-deoxy-L-arabinose transferase-like glycosyltransferase|nr:glycosyltransferase family 39 protein [Acidimicrobiales bacterium]
MTLTDTGAAHLSYEVVEAPSRSAGPWRGRPDDPAWVRPALLCLLAGSSVLYLAGLSASKWGNGYYAAAVQAATRSWKAALFGSLDSSNFITVDKPPAALWFSDLAARLFGLNHWTVLAPEALEGVACVALLYLAVRRTFSPAAGLLAGLFLAVTPVAALMFRFNNPDALLLLVILAATYAVIRAVEDGRRRWLVLAGGVIGFGFLAKELQALVVVPVLGGTYLFAGPKRLGARVADVVAGVVAMVVSAGWWLAIVVIVPASSRPYIGSSPDNNIVSLIFGYNGLGRLTGSETGAVGFESSASAGSGSAGLLRMFDAQFRTQAGWLLPAALAVGIAGLYLTRHHDRRDPVRASLLLWLGTLVVTGITLSFGRGVIHPYYSVALAPSIAALAGIGAAVAWRDRRTAPGRNRIGAALAATLIWSIWIISSKAPWTSVGRAFADLIFVLIALIIARRLAAPRATKLAVVTLILVLAGPLVWTMATVATPHETAVPIAGATNNPAADARNRAGALALLSQPSGALTERLESASPHARWMAATVGAEQAAGYQLATGRPVMAIGGFNGTDPTPTLAAFQRFVATGQLHWYIFGRIPGQGSRQDLTGTARAIDVWVQAHYRAQVVDGISVYDLTAGIPATASAASRRSMAPRAFTSAAIRMRRASSSRRSASVRAASVASLFISS